MKKLSLFVILLFVLTSLTGCLSFNPNADALIRPPRLTPDQRDVYNALVSAAGSDINLVYPKRGDYRSAFMFFEMGDEKTENALAFYTSKNDDVRIAFFSRVDGVWKIKDDLKTIGSQVDTVAFSDEKIYVGLLLGQKKSYSLYVYTLINDKLAVFYPDSYTSFALCDIDNDGTKELMLLNQSTTASSEGIQTAATQTSTLRMIKNVGNTMQTISSVSLDPSVTQYVKITSGKMADGNAALYLDGKVGQSSMSTQIIVYGDGRLQNPLYEDGSTTLTLRSQLITCRISSAGDFVEIPTLVPLPGYENVPDANKVYLTQWQQYIGGKMSVVNNQLVSLYFGFSLEIPSRWLGQMTAKYDYETSVIKFYKYTGDINDESQEYLKIRVIDSSNKNQSMNDEGYIKIKFAGKTEYTAIVTGENSDPLTMTLEEVVTNFSLFGW